MSSFTVLVPIIGVGHVYLPYSFAIPIPVTLGVITPTIMWLIKRKESHIINRCGKYNLNYTLTNLSVITVCTYFSSIGKSDYLKAFIIILVIYSAFNFILGLAAIDDPEEKDSRKFLSKLYYKFIK